MFKLTVISKMFQGAPLFAMAFSGDAVFLLGIFLTGLAFNMVRLGVWFYRVWIRRKTGSLHFITLNLPRLRAPQPQSLCASCVFAQVVRGYGSSEESVTCGYAFPPRDILFAVRECTDHKPKRECSDAEIASEGAVNLPPLEDKAANFRVAAAARQACGAGAKVGPNPEGKSSGLVLPISFCCNASLAMS
jgi:hypothetical protein